MLSCNHIIILWSNRTTKWLKSFLVPSRGGKHILSRLPLRQGSLPKNKGTSGNNFLRRTCQRGLEIHGSSKTSHFWTKNRPWIFPPPKKKIILSHFESFYFLVKSRSYYDYFWREKFPGQKVFLSPKFVFFYTRKTLFSPKFFPPKIIMFLAVRRRNKGRFCFDVTMEESDIIDIN